jgi:hypothetical protein
VLEKLHETQRNTQANTNVTDITEGWNDLVAILGDKSGPQAGPHTPNQGCRMALSGLRECLLQCRKMSIIGRQTATQPSNLIGAGATNFRVALENDWE